MSVIDAHSIFHNNVTTLKQTSYDSKNQFYMTEREINVVNFDGVKTQYLNAIGYSEEKLASVDALVEINGIQYLIEFKNGNLPKNEIKDKIKDSLLVLCDIEKINISDTRKCISFMLVYNYDKNPLDHQEEKLCAKGELKSLSKIAKHFMKKGGEEYIRFGLEKFKGAYFKDVHTYSIDEFDDFYKKVMIM